MPTAVAIGVDVPIGISDEYPRAADVAARAFVGQRAGSVFPTPTRAALEATSYADALAAQRAAVRVGLSKQAYALRTRVLEVTALAGDERVLEVHPEASFTELAGRPLASKSTPHGMLERRSALAGAGIHVSSERAAVPLVDLLDAAAAAWSADRYARGEAKPLPEGHAARIGAIWR